MTLEQELVRLYGGVARKSAGYQIPFSACTVISSQMRAPGIKVLFMHCLLYFHTKFMGVQEKNYRQPSPLYLYR